MPGGPRILLATCGRTPGVCTTCMATSGNGCRTGMITRSTRGEPLRVLLLWILEGLAAGSDRVDRGGSWLHAARNCRSAHRDSDAPGLRYGTLGFRLSEGSAVTLCTFTLFPCAVRCGFLKLEGGRRARERAEVRRTPSRTGWRPGRAGFEARSRSRRDACAPRDKLGARYGRGNAFRHQDVPPQPGTWLGALLTHAPLFALEASDQNLDLFSNIVGSIWSRLSSLPINASIS